LSTAAIAANSRHWSAPAKMAPSSLPSWAGSGSNKSAAPAAVAAPSALLELTNHAKRGYDLAVTPDAPKGPRYVVQHGVISLAQVTGLPIIPVTCNTQQKICFKSWDRFQIPLPFSRCELILNKPIFVPPRS
jgi:lysophospholipid acyltransferase (LPLAT)-like uncharacterized protein